MRRVADYKKVPKSRLRCPLCEEELNIHIDSFTCYSSVNGPYLKGRISLNCSNEACKYIHATDFHADEGKAIQGFEQFVGLMLKKLPDFGPWEVFKMTEGENRRTHRIRR